MKASFVLNISLLISETLNIVAELSINYHPWLFGNHKGPCKKLSTS